MKARATQMYNKWLRNFQKCLHMRRSVIQNLGGANSVFDSVYHNVRLCVYISEKLVPLVTSLVGIIAALSLIFRSALARRRMAVRWKVVLMVVIARNLRRRGWRHVVCGCHSCVGLIAATRWTDICMFTVCQRWVRTVVCRRKKMRRKRMPIA